ncbi:hypothetical protein [Pseudomonas koreensis]|uniref:hypothetical protein n=1 Tax=Pseudomonas koreensis TaxID=198620 RepID=UPI0018E6BDEB|nr:hypothetical protein [Pseudomonas koreensis]MBI6948563.1 hypothetical protein [Pseudomonas koreensis]
MSEAKTLVTLMLGGVFNGTSGPELGDIDYQVNFEETLALQQELVTNDDVYVDLVARTDFDAQRLRADTAEAELAKIGDDYYKRTDELICANEKLAAAEQRIAELVAAIETYLKGTGNSPGSNRRHAELRAALNPKPEAGSHDA